MRCSIRDLLWLTLTVALVAAWQLERRNFTSKLNRQAGEIAQKRLELESWQKFRVKVPAGMKVVPVNQP